MPGDPKGKGAEARARYASGRSGRTGYEQAEFINVNLNDAENDDKTVAIPSYDVLLNLWQEEIENDYKFTVKWDERNACFSAFMQSTNPEAENAGFILSARGGTPASALRECLYCHRIVLQGNWQNARMRNSRQSDNF